LTVYLLWAAVGGFPCCIEAIRNKDSNTYSNHPDYE
jgi:hypothetical protein